MKQDSYDGLTANVSWNGEVTTEFPIKRGIKQGRIAITKDYLTITTDAPQFLIATTIGISIGNYYISVPSLADDTICLVLHPHHLQLQLDN